MTHTEYTQLVNIVKGHDYRYFVLNAPSISDAEYDCLYFQLQDYEEQHPDMVLADSPTQSAHAEVKNGHKQIRRRTEMLSTEKAQTIEKVQKWMTKTTKKTGEGLYTVEWKYDGISLSLVYIDGQLTEASYGKGMEGNDCLQHCLKVASIPNTIPASGRVEVRGEMVVPFANLARTGYKNCRSAAAGIMADTASTLTDCLEFHPYWTDANIGENCRYRVEMLAKRYGFLYDTDLNNLHQFVEQDNLTEVIEYATKRRASLPYSTDGLVIKVDKMEQWDTLGRNEHHPHYAIAYKFAAATAETTVTHIEITTGKTGKRTPVAYFEPVTINGATYQKASIGSEAKLAELDLHPGDRVVVSLRNDVIPHIDGKVVNDDDNDDAPMPAQELEAPEIVEQESVQHFNPQPTTHNPQPPTSVPEVRTSQDNGLKKMLFMVACAVVAVIALSIWAGNAVADVFGGSQTFVGSLVFTIVSSSVIGLIGGMTAGLADPERRMALATR